MKDVTICLELTLPKEVTDLEIKSFVESAVKEKLDREKQFKREYGRLKPEDYVWENEGILGITESMIDVVAIADNMVAGKRLLPPIFRKLGTLW